VKNEVRFVADTRVAEAYRFGPFHLDIRERRLSRGCEVIPLRLGEDRSFYFRGPSGRLNLRAQNLELFMQLADGVDDETWLYHLQQHDVSQWFRHHQGRVWRRKPPKSRAARIPPNDSRARIRAAVQRRYTTPA
jgi:hypothetical protein